MRLTSLCGEVSATADLRSENFVQDASESLTTTSIRLCHVFGVNLRSHYKCYVDKWTDDTK
jgi:hypothetical protein